MGAQMRSAVVAALEGLVIAVDIAVDNGSLDLPSCMIIDYTASRPWETGWLMYVAVPGSFWRRGSCHPTVSQGSAGGWLKARLV